MRRTILAIVVLASLIIANDLYAQTFELQSSILWSGARDIKVQGNYAYCAFDNGLVILDVSNPTQPTFVSHARINNRPFAIDVQNNHCYIATTGKLCIYDVNDVFNPVEISFVSYTGRPGGIIVRDNFAFIVSHSTTHDGLHRFDYVHFYIVDIANPGTPYIMGSGSTSWLLPGGGIAVSGNYVYLASSWGLVIYDISNPTAPILVDSPLGYGGTDTGLLASGSVLYVMSDGTLKICDISNPDSVFLLSSTSISGYGNATKAGNYLYVAASGLQFYIFDVADPRSPRLISTLNLPDAGNGVCVNGDYAFVAAAFSGIEVISVVQPTSPEIIGAYDTHGRAVGSFISNHYAYIADYEGGMKIVDISNSNAPLIIAEYDTPGLATDIVCSNGYCYLANDSSIFTFDVSIPSSPSQIGSIGAGWRIKKMKLQGNYLYAANYDSSLLIINVSTPANPELTTNFHLPCRVLDLAVEGSFAYLVGGNLMYIVDVSDRANPIITGSADGPAPVSICVRGSYAYVADHHTWPPYPYTDYYGAVSIYDISNPYFPQWVKLYYCANFYSYSQVFITQNSVYLTGYTRDGNSFIQAKSMITPDSLVNTAHFIYSGSGLGIFADSSAVYISEQSAFEILYLNITDIEDGDPAPSSFTLSPAYPNPFNGQTSIRYSLPAAGQVRLTVYDILGREAATLYEGTGQAGEQAVTWDASGFPSGIYFARLESGERAETIKMVLLK